MEITALKQRIFIINFFSLVVILFFLLYTYFYVFVQQNFLFILLYAFCLLLVVSNWLIFKKSQNITLANNVLASLGFIALTPWFITGGIAGTGLFWFAAYIVWAIFLTGRKIGSFWLGITILASLVILILKFLGVVETPFSLLVIINFYFASLLVYILVIIFDLAREKYELSFQSKNEEINQKKIDLELALASENKKTTTLRKQSQELEDTKKAMINLLEDARVLEEQLEKGKKEVEKRVEERTKEFQEEHARLEASINSIKFGFIITNNQAEIVTINAFAKHLLCAVIPNQVFGVIRSGLEFNQKCTMVDIEKNFKKAYDLRNKILESVKKQNPIEVKELEFNGRFLHIFTAPIVVSANDKLTIIGAVSLVEDITEERILDRSKDEFFSIASHELRTPLTSIKGNAAMLSEYYADKVKDSTFREMIADIRESSERLIQIVNDFLNISRLEQGKIKFKKTAFDVTEVISETIRELEGLALEKVLYLKFDKPNQAIPEALADRDRTKEIFANLLSNSIKYTEKGGVNINLSVADGFIKISVTDTGRGISEEQQNLLFRKFQQAGENILTRDTTKGTGLGLFISRMMVEGMGGKIYLEKSEVEKGSTFAVEIPATTV